VSGCLSVTRGRHSPLPPCGGLCRLGLDPAYGMALAAALAMALLAGCSENDMVTQARYNTFEPSRFFADGQSSRPVEPGTVARGQLRLDPAFSTGVVAGALATDIPLKGFDPREKLPDGEAREARRAALIRGRERFDIYCAPCHSRTGDGNGMIVQRGFSKPPSFHEQRLREAPAGHFFHVITNGYGAMYSDASRVEPADRWAITAYVRALQASRAGAPAVASAGGPAR
jgi:mono/diheme cytochrome c family protein